MYNVTMEEGFIKGILALRTRYKQCRPGYAIYKTDGEEWIVLCDNTVVERNDTIV